MEAATGRGEAVPKGGDIAVCLNCGAPMVFEADLTIRRATRADFDQLSPEQALGLGRMCGQIERRGLIEPRRGRN